MAAVGGERRATISVDPTGGVHRQQAPMTAGRIVPIVLGLLTAYRDRRSGLSAGRSFGRTFHGHPFYRCVETWWEGSDVVCGGGPGDADGAGDLAGIGSALSADGKGGLVCCQEVRRRGGRQIMATNKSWLPITKAIE